MKITRDYLIENMDAVIEYFKKPREVWCTNTVRYNNNNRIHVMQVINDKEYKFDYITVDSNGVRYMDRTDSPDTYQINEYMLEHMLDDLASDCTVRDEYERTLISFINCYNILYGKVGS